MPLNFHDYRMQLWKAEVPAQVGKEQLSASLSPRLQLAPIVLHRAISLPAPPEYVLVIGIMMLRVSRSIPMFLARFPCSPCGWVCG